MITGESRPVHKRLGDNVIADMVNGSGSLRVQVTTVGEQTVLTGIMRLVAEAQNSRSRAQDLANRVAYWLRFIALGFAVLTLIGWVIARGFDAYTLERVVTGWSSPARTRSGWTSRWSLSSAPRSRRATAF